MLIEGKYCSLETEDEVKGRAIVNYVNYQMETPEFKTKLDQMRKNLIDYGYCDGS